MSMTIADCASETAAERRERRRQRILQNSERRLTAILSGPEGNEKRQAPSIEGIYENEDDEKTSNSTHQAIGNETSFVQDEIQFVAPVYCELVDRHRFWLMTALGIAFRLAVQMHLLEYVLLTFTALFLGWELLVAIPQKRLLKNYPKHGYLVNTLLISGLSERMVVWFGLLLDLLWEFGMDLCLVTFSFVCTHMLVQLVQFIMAAPCCSRM